MKYVYKLGVNSYLQALYFRTSEECEAFKQLCKSSGIEPNWKEPEQIRYPSLSCSTEESLDIPMNERLEILCNWYNAEG